MISCSASFACSIGDSVRSKLTGVAGVVTGLHVDASGQKLLVDTAEGRQVWMNAEHAIAGPVIDFDRAPQATPE